MIFLKKVTITKVAKKFHVYMEPKCTSPYLNTPTFEPSTKSVKSILHPHTLFL